MIGPGGPPRARGNGERTVRRLVAAFLAGWLLVFGQGWLGPRALGQGARTGPAAKILAVHANRLADEYVFVARGWDLTQIARAFNAVIIASVEDGGTAQLVQEAGAAGLRVYIEFDKKRDYAAGKDISATVNGIVSEVREHPGAITGIRVADRLNEFLDPQTALGYLKATGGVFHERIPGVQVLVDANDWELTCGHSGQSFCWAHLLDRYRYERHSVLNAFYRSGYVDGFFVSDNLQGFDPDVQATAWRTVRKMFPAPFVLFSASADLSFPDAVYPFDPATAQRQVEAFERVPLQEGADGIDLWAWHRPWNNTLRTFLNKDGSGNALWGSMVGAAAQERAR